MEVEDFLEIARNWRANGFKIALDDFGAGFVSLPFTAQLVPDYIKIDRSILTQSLYSRKFKQFSKNLIQALQSYSAKGIIMEGIETKKELKITKDLGVSIGQGYFLGEPKPLAPINQLSKQL